MDSVRLLYKVGGGWLNLFSFSYIKLCWLKPYKNAGDYSAKNFDFSETNIIGLPRKK